MAGYSRGAYTRRAYNIIVDTKKPLLKTSLISVGISLLKFNKCISKIMNFCGNAIKCQRQPQMATINKSRGANSRIFEGAY